jgi:hypothetical protein
MIRQQYILKYILEKLAAKMYAELKYPRICTNDRFCEYVNEASGSLKAGAFSAI